MMRFTWLVKDRRNNREWVVEVKDKRLVKLPPDLRGFLNEPFESLLKYLKNWSYGFPPLPPKKPDGRQSPTSGNSSRIDLLAHKGRSVTKSIKPKPKKGKRKRFW